MWKDVLYRHGKLIKNYVPLLALYSHTCMK